jgi:hypothetical protein
LEGIEVHRGDMANLATKSFILSSLFLGILQVHKNGNLPKTGRE